MHCSRFGPMGTSRRTTKHPSRMSIAANRSMLDKGARYYHIRNGNTSNGFIPPHHDHAHTTTTIEFLGFQRSNFFCWRSRRLFLLKGGWFVSLLNKCAAPSKEDDCYE